MTIHWEITKEDIKKLEKFVNSHKQKEFVNYRIERNTNSQFKDVSENEIIKAMLMCLLTSQQRSGPNSKIAKFLNQNTFPINTKWINNNKSNIQMALRQELIKWGLTRYINKIIIYFDYNINYFDTHKWIIKQSINELKKKDSMTNEREFADFIAEELKGFGPKQSRNFLQALGATKYEIPIDSRITKWLNGFGFPLKLNSKNLQDRYYYHFVNDGIIKLCLEIKLLPCIFDAIIFSSYDNDEWTKENMIF